MISLTESHRSEIFPAGFYDEFTVTTDITSLPANVMYDHHIHSITSANSIITTDTPGLTPDGYEDNYQTTEPCGCFTKPYYYYSVRTITGYHRPYCYPHNGRTYCNECGRDGPEGYCSNCGLKPDYSTVYQWNETLPSGASLIKTEYIRNCGKIKGEIVAAHIVY